MPEPPFSQGSWACPHELDLFRGLRRRALVTLGTAVGWLSLMLLYLAFWAGHFSLLQSVVLVVVSLLVLAAVLLGVWASFGLRLLSQGD